MSSRVRVVSAGLVLALSVALGTVALPAQQAPQPKAVPAQAAPAGAPKSLAGQEKSLRDVMNGMKGNLKTLDAACTAKSKEPALAAVCEMERLILVAKSFEPQNLA